MIPDAPACVVLHLGAATTATALLGRVDDRWRLVGTLAAPAGIDPDDLISALADRLAAADPPLAERLGAADAAAWPRLVARGGAAPPLAVLAATDRTLERLERAGRRAGWTVVGRSAQRADPLEMTRILLARDIGTVLVGAADPPAPDERQLLGDLAALVAAAAERRPELTVVLAGAFADLSDRFASARGAHAVEATAQTAPAGGPDTGPATGADEDDGERPATAGEQATGPGQADDTGPEGAATGDAPAAPALATDEAAAPGAGGSVDAAGTPATVGSGSASIATASTELPPPAVGGPAAGSLIIAPAPRGGTPPDEPLRRLLDDLRAAPDDAWRGIVRSTETLAVILERRVETIALGQSAGLRVVAAPEGASGSARVAWVIAPEAALIPDVDEALVDRVLRWSTTTTDRYRLRDRLAELRLAPWGEIHGDGAPFRMAVARAALERLVALTPEFARPTPDLVIASGGVWAVAPGPAVALAVADVVRRPGASQLALDHARLLGAIGTIDDAPVRARMLADLAEDLLAPLGSVVLPAGLRTGRSAGRLVVHAAAGTTELDLVPGGLELVDLPPGDSAVAEFQFADTVVLGTRGRRFSLDVGGGLGGLLVDLRDVPLRLPERPDRRRELLGAWQRALWTGLET